MQQIRPFPTEVEQLLDKTGMLVSGAEREAEWPLVAEKEVAWPQGSCEIEPGERQQLDFDFAVESSLTTVLAYAYVKNLAKRKTEIGWDAQMAVDLVERQPKGVDGAEPEAARPSAN
jgi:hypothetical protein